MVTVCVTFPVAKPEKAIKPTSTIPNLRITVPLLLESKKFNLVQENRKLVHLEFIFGCPNPKTFRQYIPGGRLFHLTTPHVYKFGHVRESDMIFTVVDSCKFLVRSEKAKAPIVELKKLTGNLNFACDNKQSRQLKSISGVGKHFVALKVGRTEIYRRHPSKVLGTGMNIFVVNNFGAKKIRLEYMQKKTVTIGPETITIESHNFKYATKSVEIKIATESKAAKAEALIVEYSD